MSWRKVTEDDLISALSQDEVDAYRASFPTGDPIDKQIRGAVAYVRGVIRSAPTKVQMNPDETTLPESLILPAMDHLRFSVLMILNISVNESRTKAYENADKLFLDIRGGKFIPESDGVTDDSRDIAGSPTHGTPNPSRLLD